MTAQSDAITDRMDKVVSLCKRRGFVYQSSSIYGGLKSAYDYGPLGCELKRNVKAQWWCSMVTTREDVVGLDASIMMAPKVWEASGHLSGFSDPLVDCLVCKTRFRADTAPTAPTSGDFELRFPDKGAAKAADESIPRMLELENIRSATDNLAASVGLPKQFTGPGVSSVKGVERLGKTVIAHGVKGARGYVCPECGSPFLSTERQFNLMFRTFLGAVDPVGEAVDALQTKLYRPAITSLHGEDPDWKQVEGEPGKFENADGDIQPGEGVALDRILPYLGDPRALGQLIEEALGPSTVYLRPETAQAMFVNFKNVLDSFPIKLPFGIAQQGKSFRNEITVEHFIFRSCEFEQMEMEFFCHPGEAPKWFDYWRQARFDWYVNLGARPENLRLRDHDRDELAHYAKENGACSDVEYRYPWGWGELEGIANRTDYDLRQHAIHAFGGGAQKFQKLDEKKQQKVIARLAYFDAQTKQHIVPYVIEPAAGVDRTMLMFLLDAYDEEPPKNDEKEGRVVLRLDPRLAPIKCAVLPLVKKDGMPERAREVFTALSDAGLAAKLDSQHAIGRRYRRHDEIGTPFCITVDGQTMQDGTVTLRFRDDMAQVRLAADEALAEVVKRTNRRTPGPVVGGSQS